MVAMPDVQVKIKARYLSYHSDVYLEFHNAESGLRVLIPLLSITSIEELDTGSVIYVQHETFYVKESYSEIAARIEELAENGK